MEMQTMLEKMKIEKEKTEELLKEKDEILRKKEEELETRDAEQEKLKVELKKLQKTKEFKPNMIRRVDATILAAVRQQGSSGTRAKENLTYATVSAVEQLQVMTSKRQYKEAATQLETVVMHCPPGDGCKVGAACICPNQFLRYEFFVSVQLVYVQIRSHSVEPVHVLLFSCFCCFKSWE
ncbi:unnamed protein product [Arabidopsis halleri]